MLDVGFVANTDVDELTTTSDQLKKHEDRDESGSGPVHGGSE